MTPCLARTELGHDPRGRDLRPSDQVAEIIRTLSNRRFLRAPLLPTPALQDMIQGSVARGQALSAVLLWGAGTKCEPDLIERLSADFLARYAARVERVWSPGLRFRIVFADTHAEINGHDRFSIERYFSKVRSVLGNVGDFDRLSRCWRFAGLSLPAIEQLEENMDPDEWRHADDQARLVEGAIRNCISGEPRRAARLYYVARREENRILPLLYPSALFVTFEAECRSFLLPDMARIHLFSWARGRCSRPWNVERRENRAARQD
jgi:L-tyrosine isonitrile synthase